MANREPVFSEISIQVGEQKIAFKGSFVLPDVQTLIDKWFAALDSEVQRRVDALAAQLSRANDKLAATVATVPPA